MSDTDFSKGVLFDPGYSNYTLPFTQNIDAVYNLIFSIKAVNQRKFKFQMCYPQILKLMEHTVSFYLGCLLWATFIKNNFKNDPKEILDNDYLGKEVNEDAMLFEVNYAISYFDKMKKDCAYYLNKACNLPADWLEILNVYKDFLTENKFLTAAKTTDDLVLPSKIKDLSQEDLQKILEKIEEVTKSGELKDLFKVKKLILD